MFRLSLDYCALHFVRQILCCVDVHLAYLSASHFAWGHPLLSQHLKHLLNHSQGRQCALACLRAWLWYLHLPVDCHEPASSNASSHRHSHPVPQACWLRRPTSTAVDWSCASAVPRPWWHYSIGWTCPWTWSGRPSCPACSSAPLLALDSVAYSPLIRTSRKLRCTSYSLLLFSSSNGVNLTDGPVLNG